MRNRLGVPVNYVRADAIIRLRCPNPATKWFSTPEEHDGSRFRNVQAVLRGGSWREAPGRGPLLSIFAGGETKERRVYRGSHILLNAKRSVTCQISQKLQ